MHPNNAVRTSFSQLVRSDLINSAPLPFHGGLEPGKVLIVSFYNRKTTTKKNVLLERTAHESVTPQEPFRLRLFESFGEPI